MIRVKTDSLQDRAAIQVEIRRLQRIEAKADSGMREAIVRRIQELQNRLHESAPFHKLDQHRS